MKKEKFLSYLVILAGILVAVILGIRSWSGPSAKKTDAPASAKKTTVTVPGFGGDMQIEVSADENKIYAVNVLSNQETEGIGSKAVAALPGKMVEEQTFNVDGISGATISSTALRTGVEQALKEMGLDTEKFSKGQGSDSGEPGYRRRKLRTCDRRYECSGDQVAGGESF